MNLLILVQLGRGTNIPGDGDFDFMLKCASKEEQEELIGKISELLRGRDKGGSNDYQIRYEDVKIPGLQESVEIDITSEKKRLEVDYSSDMCVKDRLSNIRRQYGEEGLRTVLDNIIVAKKFLKEKGIYKRISSPDSTHFGGLGGIGVENWILQNGGSFVGAMRSFMEASKDENGNDISFEEFRKNYPIYDFGQNHRADVGQSDHFMEGVTESGFDKMKRVFAQELDRLELLAEERTSFTDSILRYSMVANGYSITDMSRIYGLIAGLNTYQLKQASRGGTNRDE